MKITGQKSDCYGCAACKSICPRSAINMVNDIEGFAYPTIDEELCIHCDRCIAVCPAVGERTNTELPKRAFGFLHNDDNVRTSSSSGGFFTALSDYVLGSDGGVVYGAAYNERHEVIHIKAENTHERDKIRGSKYVQSSMENIYTSLHKDLKSGRWVLFSGTPCQVHAVKNRFHGYENLITADLICHGVPSPKLWRDFIEWLEQKSNTHVERIAIRDTKHRWGDYITTVKYNDGRTEENKFFLKLFFTNNALRPSCYKCKYTTYAREGDFTMGDFWGIGNVCPEMKDDKGVSFIYANTTKALDIIDCLKTSGNFRDVNYTDSVQPQLQKPIKLPNTRRRFWKKYNKAGFEKIIDRYAINARKQVIKPWIYKCLKRLHIR